MKKSDSPLSKLTRTCSLCGQLKPMSAFLLSVDEKEINYSSICSYCRKKQAEEQPPESKGSGKGVDVNTKIQIDFDKAQKDKDAKEQHSSEQMRDEQLLRVRTDKATESVKNEKNRREGLFQTKTTETTTKKVAETLFGGAEHVSKAEEISEASAIGSIVQDTQITSQRRTGRSYLEYQARLGKSSPANQFKSWLGANSPIVKTAEKALLKAQEAGKHPETSSEKEFIQENARRSPGKKK